MARTKKAEQITHKCSRSGFTFTGTPDEVAEFFYRDKSTASGFSPWCKDAEREYNRAYRAANTAAGVNRKMDADAEGVKVFDATMQSEGVRTPRKAAAKVVAKSTKKSATKSNARKASPVKVTRRKPQARKTVPVTAK